GEAGAANAARAAALLGAQAEALAPLKELQPALPARVVVLVGDRCDARGSLQPGILGAQVRLGELRERSHLERVKVECDLLARRRQRLVEIARLARHDDAPGAAHVDL